MTVEPPACARRVLETLEQAGYRAYYVGGCVRDLLLNRRPQDWDVCTSALPEDTERLFRKTIPTGKRHGTITVRSQGRSVEVTTFRAESKYADHRRPERVRFVPDLKEDLRRRDFTMNAIAMDARGELFDPYGGEDDIRAGIIRAVGEPAQRFEEDALRMLRAFRFRAKLGFDIEPETYAAIKKCAPLCAALAPERVHTEIEGILCSARPETVSDLIGCGLLDSLLLPGEAVSATRLRRLPKDRRARWAGFCAALVKAGRIESAEAFLRALRLERETIRSCAAGVCAAFSEPPEGENGWKRFLSKNGETAAFCAACAMETLGPCDAMKQLKAVLQSGACYSLRQLAVGGDDLQSLGFRGKEIGAVLQGLLEEVIRDPKKNDRQILLEIAEMKK